MKTAVYTFKNKKPILIEVNKYYFLKNNKELNDLVYQLSEIDAVAYPTSEEIKKYPIILKIKKLSFGFNFEIATPKEYLAELKSSKRIIDKNIEQLEKYEKLT